MRRYNTSENTGVRNQTRKMRHFNHAAIFLAPHGVGMDSSSSLSATWATFGSSLLFSVFLFFLLRFLFRLPDIWAASLIAVDPILASSCIEGGALRSSSGSIVSSVSASVTSPDSVGARVVLNEESSSRRLGERGTRPVLPSATAINEVADMDNGVVFSAGVCSGSNGLGNARKVEGE